jgi:hypothetical protein
LVPSLASCGMSVAATLVPIGVLVAPSLVLSAGKILVAPCGGMLAASSLLTDGRVVQQRNLLFF